MHGRGLAGNTGVPNEVEVFVLVDVVSAGSSTTTYTHTIAVIDPPLFLGLEITRPGWLARKLHPPRHPFGDPKLDDVLRLDARLAPRATVLFTSRGGPAANLADYLLDVKGIDFRIADGTVDLFSDDGVITDPGTLAWRLEHAVWLAASIADQDAWLPVDASHAELEGTLRAFADSARFVFDAKRMQLDGDVAGAQVRLALESEPGGLFTAVTVVLPRRLEPGLGNGALRRAIVELADGARDVRIDDGRLFFRDPMPATQESRLRGIVDRIRVAIERFFPGPGSVGPYR